MKHRILTGLAAVLMANGVIIAAPPASAGCQNADWPEHPLAQMCDGPISHDGSWERCLTNSAGDSWNSETNCYPMRAGQPVPGDSVLGTPLTHIDD
jgi:hypothetical protein